MNSQFTKGAVSARAFSAATPDFFQLSLIFDIDMSFVFCKFLNFDEYFFFQSEPVVHESVSPDEQERVRKIWSQGLDGAPRPIKREHPM